jgi:hypothetical protein
MDDVLDKISTGIWVRFSQQINDVVFLSNNAFDKKTFIIISGLSSQNTGEIVEEHGFTYSYNLDDILDQALAEFELQDQKQSCNIKVTRNDNSKSLISTQEAGVLLSKQSK